MGTGTEECDNQEQVSEDYQTDRYEQDRFTNTYAEDFEDDENKADRFNDDYTKISD